MVYLWRNFKYKSKNFFLIDSLSSKSYTNSFENFNSRQLKFPPNQTSRQIQFPQNAESRKIYFRKPICTDGKILFPQNDKTWPVTKPLLLATYCYLWLPIVIFGYLLFFYCKVAKFELGYLGYLLFVAKVLLRLFGTENESVEGTEY